MNDLLDGESTTGLDARGEAISRRRGHSIRGTSSLAARLSGLLLLAAAALAFGCGESSPETAGSPVEPQLAKNFSCSNVGALPKYPDEPSGFDTVAKEICDATATGHMGPNDVNAALNKLIQAIKDTTGEGEANLKRFVTLKWKGTADDLEHLLDHIVLAEAGVVDRGAVVDKDGDQECLPDDKACADFDPAWSTVDRIWVRTDINCSELGDATSLDVFGVCQHYETQPAGVFLEPVDLVLCYEGPSTVTPTLAKVFESPDDPLGTNFEDIEYFDSEAATDPPGCASLLASRTAGPTSGAGTALAGQKGGGPNGLALQGGVGTRISSFSDWGFVDLESALVEGTITSSADSSAISGATVEIFCEGATTADTTATSVGDGSYSMDNDTTHVFLPDDECKVKATADGFEPDSTATFTVQKGLNDGVDVTLDPAID
ncbi:MAG TPA: carboxypeptidase-like regulatory domain-containing protein [Gemmatimonadota bacterium]|jgi:hypothetical protein